MSKYLILLVTSLVLIAGCTIPEPKDTPEDIQTTGSVEVSSTPQGAEVYLDNVYKGTTPVTIIEQSGSYILELRLRDHQSWSKSIQIVGGTKVYMDTALAPVLILTSLQTTVLTTRPTTVPTTRPRLVTTPTKEPITIPTTTPTTKLTTPTPLSPVNGQIFTGRVRWTTFTWSQVKGAEKYLVEVQDFIPSKNEWVRGYEIDVLTSPYSVQLWNGAGVPSEPVTSFRWRVSAKNFDTYATSTTSEWRNFTWQDS